MSKGLILHNLNESQYHIEILTDDSYINAIIAYLEVQIENIDIKISVLETEKDNLVDELDFLADDIDAILADIKTLNDGIEEDEEEIRQLNDRIYGTLQREDPLIFNTEPTEESQDNAARWEREIELNSIQQENFEEQQESLLDRRGAYV